METLEVEKLDGDELAEVRYRVGDLFEVGFERNTILSDEIYVTLKPLAGLPQSRFALRWPLDEFSGFYGATFWCCVELDDSRSLRFAQFFGFEPVGLFQKKLYMQKVT